jgi:hypothetical protein
MAEKYGFGLIHELARVETEVNRELRKARHLVYVASHMIGDRDVPPETIQKTLAEAMEALKRVSGD